MKVKGIELMKMIADGRIQEETEIKCTDGYIGIYVFKNKELKHKVSNVTIFNRYSLKSFLNTYFEILEDKTEEIEEIEVDRNNFIHTELGSFKGRKMDIAFVNKFNELTKIVNKQNKQDTSKETNCMTD